MSYFFKKLFKRNSLKAISTLCVVSVLTSCGQIDREPRNPRSYINLLETEEFEGGASEGAEMYVDYTSSELTACQWHRKLEKRYSSRTGRFRLLGHVQVWKAPEENKGPLLFQIILGVVEIFMPWTWFKGVEKVELPWIPLGRVDMKGHVLHSVAFLTGADGQLPNREEFIDKVGVALRASGDHFKLAAFRLGLATGTINAEEKRDEIVQEEIQKVFPGFFSQRNQQDISESFAWVLMMNALRQKKYIQIDDLKVFSRKLPVFRAGGWAALSNDMKIGLAAAIKGLDSKSSRERACASNLIFRSSDQLIQLMGQETLPLYDSRDGYSYSNSIREIVSGTQKLKLKKCRAAGSLVRKNMRVTVSENTLENIADKSDSYSWADSPQPMKYCRPDGNGWASGYPSKSSKTLDTMLSRLGAFSHYLFAFNPNARWWVKRGKFPMGDFEGLKDIQDTGALAPAKVHLLALALMQLDFEHFQNRHLVYLDEDGKRTFDDNEAMGIRFSENPLNNNSTLATTSLESSIKFFNLVLKFDRYLASLERWKRTSHFRKWRVNDLFGSRKIFDTLIGEEGNSNRDIIQKLYLAASLMFPKFISDDDVTQCTASLRTNLKTGEETASGDCGDLKPELAKTLNVLGDKMGSALLKRQASLLAN